MLKMTSISGLTAIKLQKPSNNWGLSLLLICTIIICFFYVTSSEDTLISGPLDDGVSFFYEKNGQITESDLTSTPPIGSTVSVSVKSLSDIHSFFGLVANDGTLVTSFDQFLSSQFPISKGERKHLPITVKIKEEAKNEVLTVINCDQSIFTKSPHFSKELQAFAEGGIEIQGCKRHRLNLH